MSASSFVVRPVDWSAARDELRAVRRVVFIEEQNVPEELEWDDADASAYHVLATDENGKPIGTGRLKPDGGIGRMAVLRAWRGRGVGQALLQALIARAGVERRAGVHLNAQIHAVGFYERAGFRCFGPEFDEAGIPHVAMALALLRSC